MVLASECCSADLMAPLSWVLAALQGAQLAALAAALWEPEVVLEVWG